MFIVANPDLIGVDVSKDWLDIYDGSQTRRIDNTKESIVEYFSQFSKPIQLAIEPTNNYHNCFIDCAHPLGHQIYLVDAYRLSRYRDAVGLRAKTDSADAQLLYRYLSSEGQRLTTYSPSSQSIRQLHQLLRVRGKLGKERVRIGQFLAGLKDLSGERQQILSEIEKAIMRIDEQLNHYLGEAGYLADFERCLKVPGIGPVISTALVATYHRGRFKSSDAFIAFLGLDVRVRESGKFKGQRKLTKKGNPEIRRLLFNGARAGSRSNYWNDFYLKLRERGLSTTAAAIAIARKIARLAFALMRDKSEFLVQKA